MLVKVLFQKVHKRKTVGTEDQVMGLYEPSFDSHCYVAEGLLFMLKGDDHVGLEMITAVAEQIDWAGVTRFIHGNKKSKGVFI